VEATDASSEQLRHAMPHPRITYRRAQADASGLETASANVVSVAQALHWLPHDRFYAEVTRVLAPARSSRGAITCPASACHRSIRPCSTSTITSLGHASGQSGNAS
jgi:hypothetical protein